MAAASTVASYFRVSSAQAGHTFAFPSSRCISRALPPIATATGAPPTASAARTHTATLHARVAGWSRDASGQATTTGGYTRAPGCFPASPSPPTSINRPEPSFAGASSAQKSRPGASRQNRNKGRGLSANSVTQCTR